MERLAAAVLCAVTVACGSPAPNPSQPSGSQPPSFALTGRVNDAATSSPIAAAVVQAFDSRNIPLQFATSDTTGAFRFAELPRGDYALRVTRSGYDSAYLAVTLVRDTSADFQLNPLMTTLAGTWVGFVAFSLTPGSLQSAATVPWATLTHAGTSLLSDQFTVTTAGRNDGSPLGGLIDQARFSGTLQDPSALGSKTGITGALTFIQNTGRTCQGTTAVTGTINWNQMSVTAPQITFCGVTYTNVTLSLIKQR